MDRRLYGPHMQAGSWMYEEKLLPMLRAELWAHVTEHIALVTVLAELSQFVVYVVVSKWLCVHLQRFVPLYKLHLLN